MLSSLDARLFASIAECGGISAAARRLGLQKSLVSRELAALEQRLGMRLVNRTTRRLSLTDAGEILLASAQRIVVELDAAEIALEALQDEPCGELRVTAPYSVIRFVLAPRLLGFQQRYPNLRLSLDPTTKVLDLVEAGIDVAIRIGDLPSSSLVVSRLATVNLVLVSSKAYEARRGLPREPAELVGHDVIFLGDKAEARPVALHGSAGQVVSVQVTPRLAIHDPGLVLDLVQHGLGIAVAPEIYVTDKIRAGALVRVLPGFTLGTRPVQAVYPSKRLLMPKVRAFLDCAAAAFEVQSGIAG